MDQKNDGTHGEQANKDIYYMERGNTGMGMHVPRCPPSWWGLPCQYLVQTCGSEYGWITHLPVHLVLTGRGGGGEEGRGQRAERGRHWQGGHGKRQPWSASPGPCPRSWGGSCLLEKKEGAGQLGRDGKIKKKDWTSWETVVPAAARPVGGSVDWVDWGRGKCPG